jgi:hypothetical protein
VIGEIIAIEERGTEPPRDARPRVLLPAPMGPLKKIACVMVPAAPSCAF